MSVRTKYYNCNSFQLYNAELKHIHLSNTCMSIFGTKINPWLHINSMILSYSMEVLALPFYSIHRANDLQMLGS